MIENGFWACAKGAVIEKKDFWVQPPEARIGGWFAK
jgi:hypothetical protein